MQSAPYVDDGIVIYSTRPLAVAERFGEGLSRKLGCAESADELAALRSVPADRLLEVGDPGDDIFPTGITYQPVVDGWVLPDVPVDLLAEGRFAQVPLLIGSTREEAAIAAVSTGADGLDPAEAERDLRRIYGDAASTRSSACSRATQGPTVPATIQTEERPAGGANGGDDATADGAGGRDDELLDAAPASVTLTLFTAPTRYAADRMAATGTPTYRYLFTATPLGERLGAFHGSELPYVFGADVLDLDLGGDRSVELSATMMRYWTSFAAGGDPNVDGLPQWPRWSSEAQPTQELGWTIRTVDRYEDRECDVAERLFVPAR